MPENKPARFLCPVCQAAFTEKDLEEGRALKRGSEVYCLNHFRLRFPDECEKHPGSQATLKCDQCGRKGCPDCIVDIGGELTCASCKSLRVAEIITGRQIEPIERKRPIRHTADELARKRPSPRPKKHLWKAVKETGRKIVKAPVILTDMARRFESTGRQAVFEKWMLGLSVVGFAVPALGAFVFALCMLNWLALSALAKRTSRRARLALILGAVSIPFWIIILLVVRSLVI